MLGKCAAGQGTGANYTGSRTGLMHNAMKQFVFVKSIEEEDRMSGLLLTNLRNSKLP